MINEIKAMDYKKDILFVGSVLSFLLMFSIYGYVRHQAVVFIIFAVIIICMGWYFLVYRRKTYVKKYVFFDHKVEFVNLKGAVNEIIKKQIEKIEIKQYYAVLRMKDNTIQKVFIHNEKKDEIIKQLQEWFS